MPIADDILAAKRSICGRLLRAGLRGGVVAARPPVRIAAAVAAAGHNVHAVGVGRKIVGGRATEDRCVRFYVVQKLSKALVPPHYRLPERIDGVPTDVIESLPAFALDRKVARKGGGKSKVKAGTRAAEVVQETCSNSRQRRQRPVIAGISVAHEDVTAGTLACFCRSTSADDGPADVFVLSNNHVFADTDRGRIGDELYQPGPADGGGPDDQFAELHRFVTIALGGQMPNLVDAAIGRLLPGVDHVAEVCTIGALTGAERGVEDMPVRKHGRTTGYTEGIVTDESYDALVGMDPSDPSAVALFEDQMRIEVTAPFTAFGLGGDSGSLIVNGSAATAVGLFFAGPESGTYGIANHFDDVLEALDIALA